MNEGKRDWRAVFESFHIALDLRKLGLAFCSWLVVIVAFCAVTAIFGHGEQTGQVVRALTGTDVLSARTVVSQVGEAGLSGLERLIGFVYEVISSYSPKEVIMGVILVLVFLATTAYFGGAISRIAAVEFVKGERIEVIEAARFAWRKKWSYLWAPLAVFLAIVAFGVCLFLGGLLVGKFYYVLGIVLGMALFGYLMILFKEKLFSGKYSLGGIILSLLSLGMFIIIYIFFGRLFPEHYYIPWVGEVIAAFISVFAFLAALFMTMLAIGGGFGFGMMWPTISVEGTDSFDAISRAFSYVFSKPWRFIYYNVVGLVYAALCFLFVAGVAWLTTRLAIKIPALALWNRREVLLGALGWDMTLRESGGMALLVVFLRIWLGAVRLVVLSFGGSLAVTSATVIYFLMRKAVDGTEMSEVYMEEEPARGGPEEEVPSGELEGKEEGKLEGTPGAEMGEPPAAEEDEG